MWGWLNRIPGSTFLERAQNTIGIINKQLSEGGEVTQATVRVTLRHPAIPNGIIASAFCRKSHTVVLLPVLGAALGVKERDRVGNPLFVSSPWTKPWFSESDWPELCQVRTD